MTTTPPPDFDRETAVHARPGAPGAYDTDLPGAWKVGQGINGGVLLAVTARALSAELGAPRDDRPGHPDPLSVSAYYLSTATAGPAVVRTETIRRGNSVSHGGAELLQQEDPATAPVPRLRVLAAYGTLADQPDDVWTSAKPPSLAPVEQCIGSDAAPPEFRAESPMLDRADLRLDPSCVGWAVGAPSGRGEMKGWFRLPESRDPDTLLLLTAVDILPPVTFDLGMPGWAPTLELTAHVRASPAPGWLRVIHTTRNVAGGCMEEDAEIWDSADRLVAQSRQLARLPRQP
ncbi:thioesterase family protein [Streptomyces sp. WMMC500]|uniref:thioesterase family protein n=1 Tax=Streptomyces sp. WMMC500 TaxID=3015154 RepID=UPI00248D00AD|nr:thioesterase family protein [Streptomyces sp. WMMC500]WBB62085.1 thioesterase family protein [Streptomyces sp. WMMC500]